MLSYWDKDTPPNLEAFPPPGLYDGSNVFDEEMLEAWERVTYGGIQLTVASRATLRFGIEARWNIGRLVFRVAR